MLYASYVNVMSIRHVVMVTKWWYYGRKCMFVHHTSTSVRQMDSTTVAYVSVYGIKEE